MPQGVWGVTDKELIEAYDRSVAAGCTPRAIAVINPGNPTGQSLPQERVEGILRFAAERGLVVMADEVYQENVYGEAPKFTSFKRAYSEMAKSDAAMAAKVQLVSFHSSSKGFYGECGLRGGYFELCNFPLDIKAQLVKLASLTLCSNVVGQVHKGPWLHGSMVAWVQTLYLVSSRPVLDGADDQAPSGICICTCLPMHMDTVLDGADDQAPSGICI